MTHLLKALIPVCLFFVGISTNCHASSAKVYGEGGYAGDTFLMKIFSDIDADDAQGPLVSAGVKITYPAGKLSQPVVVENLKDWSFSSQVTPHSYIDATNDSQGVVKVLLGKLDSKVPLAGVKGKRVLLASVTFVRNVATEVPLPQDFSISCANEAPFADFVTTQGNQLDDSVTFESLQVSPMNALLLRDVMRILRVTSGVNSNAPVRPSEFDANADGKVDLIDAFDRLRSTGR